MVCSGNITVFRNNLSRRGVVMGQDVSIWVSESLYILSHLLQTDSCASGIFTHNLATVSHSRSSLAEFGICQTFAQP